MALKSGMNSLLAAVATAFSGFAILAAETAVLAVPRVIAADAAGRIELHAREVTIHGTTVRYEPQPHKNTIGYWTKVGDWVSWDFQLIQPGRYKIEILQACGKGSGGSEFILSVGEQHFTNTVVETGAFTNFITRAIGVADLSKAGLHTLSVKPVKKPGQAVMDLRMVTLSPVKDSAP